MKHLGLDLYCPDAEKSVTRVLSAARELLGTGSSPLSPPPASVDSVGVVIIDSLPRGLLYGSDGFFNSLFSDTGELVSSVFPTVTQSALASLITESPPAVHGIVGSRFLVNDIVVDPFLPGPEKNLLLASPSKDIKILFPAYLRGSMFSRELSKISGVSFYYTLVDGISMLGKLLQKKEIVILYIPDLDGLVHKYGPTARETKIALQLIQHAFLSLSRRLGKKAILFTGDHGQVPISSTRVLNRHAFISISQLTGGREWRSGRVWHFETTLESTLRNTFYASEEKLKQEGLFISRKSVEKLMGGKLSSEAEERVGSFLFLPANEHEILPPGAHVSAAQHGSLTMDELSVPVLYWLP